MRVRRELGVRYVVEGSVWKVGDRVRITAQLIDAATGAHIWAETYDRELRDIFAVQDEISDAIVRAMQPELLRTEKKRVLRRNTEDLDAWDTLLRGTWHYRQFTREDDVKARALYGSAIELDPNDSSGFAGLALTHHLDLQYHWSMDPDESAALLQRTARRAVALDPRDIRAHYALAFAHGRALAPRSMMAWDARGRPRPAPVSRPSPSQEAREPWTSTPSSSEPGSGVR